MPVALDPNDTIAAVASPAGPALRGIVRLSGPAALEFALEHFTPIDDTLPCRRTAHARQGSLRVDGVRPLLPAMLALWPAPRTYTGQDVAEVHISGSVPLVNALLAHYVGRGARLAEPGEFTLRAFLSGRIDLTQSEAVLGVIEAQNPAQLDAALRQMAGGLSGPLLALRDRLLDIVAHLEANLDFSEEPDVDPLGRAALAQELNRSAADLAALGRQLVDRGRPDGQARVVLVGPPNAGKSRLFNALLGRDRAIVSTRAGTTRDYLAEPCRCDDLAVELVDTAGVEEPATAVAAQAQALRALQAAGADLLLDCRSAEQAAVLSPSVGPLPPRLYVWTKADQALPEDDGAAPSRWIVTSAATGQGLARLRSSIAAKIRSQDKGASLPAGTAARCEGNIRQAGAALDSAARTILEGGGDELVAFDLRLAVDELGKVVGAVVTDDILDRIFSRFCIGK